MNKLTVIVAAAVMSVCAFACTGRPAAENTEKIGIIFDTDMGNDIDDALALDMLYKFMDAGKIELLGIMSNKNDPRSAEFIDIMGTWYGYPDVPVGIVRDGVDTSADGINSQGVNYLQAVCEMNENGVPVFKRSIEDFGSLPDAYVLYRKLLAGRPDHSVVIVSVGFSTNLARLLDSPADAYSPLTGRELVAEKVRSISVMAGNFVGDRFSEYNVNRDIPSARKLFAECPVEINVSPFELGNEICYPGESIENGLDRGVPHPVAEAYKAYLPMPYDRPTWDLTAVLWAVEPADRFVRSEKGVVVIDPDGLSSFMPCAEGRHYLLSTAEGRKEIIKERFVELISTKPAMR